MGTMIITDRNCGAVGKTGNDVFQAFVMAPGTASALNKWQI
jgi:hypothetical protein